MAPPDSYLLREHRGSRSSVAETPGVVTAGLDPAIQTIARRSALRGFLDPWNKPGATQNGLLRLGSYDKCPPVIASGAGDAPPV
ncbi:MAG: hypothetical protein AAFW01_08375, partial [Pseudomonadota bacterium]